jgi:hypothetical protein
MVHDHEASVSVWRRIVSIFDHSFIDWSLSSSLSVKRKSFYLALKKKANIIASIMAAKKEIVITGKGIYKCTVQQPHRIISDVDRR